MRNNFKRDTISKNSIQKTLKGNATANARKVQEILRECSWESVGVKRDDEF